MAVRPSVGPQMLPAGFMAKKISVRPDWLKCDSVSDIYSVSDCVSENFCDFDEHWKHNGFWLFDSPEILREVAQAESVDLADCKFFYYEVYEQQFDERTKAWERFEPMSGLVTAAVPPKGWELEGFDVVTFAGQNGPEHSPLSCNHMAESIPVNGHCLLAAFEDAKGLLESGAFDKCECGPYRIVAVYAHQRPVLHARMPNHV